MEWSNDLVLEFLELYEGEPAIWNPKDPKHKNRNLVHDSWKKIENNLSVKVSVADLKKKKETLMATYRKLLQKVKISSGTGSGTDDVYKPDWFAFECMHKFLHGVYKPSKTKNSEFQILEDIENINSENTNQNEGDQPHEEEKKENDSSRAQPAIINTEKGKKRKAETTNSTTESRIEEAYQILKKVSKPESNTLDECSLYGELLATKLRSLDATSRGLAMLEIDQLMFRLTQQKNYTYQGPQSSTAYNSWFGQYSQPMRYPSTASYYYPIPQQSRSSSVTSQPQSSPHYSYQSDPITPQSSHQQSPQHSHQPAPQYSHQPSPQYSHQPSPQYSHQPSPQYSPQISTQYSQSPASTPLASPLPLSESIVLSRNNQSPAQESQEDSCEANQDQDLDIDLYMLSS